MIGRTGLTIMKALATFQYLTVKQMVSLGLLSARCNLYPHLKKLLEEKTIKRYRYGMLPAMGKTQDIYMLTEKGVKILGSWLNDIIKYPSKGANQFTHDYFHRIGLIDIQISIFKRINDYGRHINKCDRYFEAVKGGKKRGRPMMVTSMFVNGCEITPDMSLIIEGREKLLFNLEYERGGYLQRIKRKIELYFAAMERGIPTEKYNLAIPSRLLIITEKPRFVDSVINVIREIPGWEPFDKYVLLKPVSKIAEFGKRRRTANGGIVDVMS